MVSQGGQFRLYAVTPSSEVSAPRFPAGELYHSLTD